MLGTPQGINQHIKHNITSCTGVQSLVPSGELLHFVLLPQFKSQGPETNAPQTALAHAKRTPGSTDRLHGGRKIPDLLKTNRNREVLFDTIQEINIKLLRKLPAISTAVVLIWVPFLFAASHLSWSAGDRM